MKIFRSSPTNQHMRQVDSKQLSSHVSYYGSQGPIWFDGNIDSSSLRKVEIGVELETDDLQLLVSSRLGELDRGIKQRDEKIEELQGTINRLEEVLDNVNNLASIVNVKLGDLLSEDLEQVTQLLDDLETLSSFETFMECQSINPLTPDLNSNCSWSQLWIDQECEEHRQAS